MSREILQYDQCGDLPPPKAGRIFLSGADSPENPVGSKGFSGPLDDVSRPIETERLGNSAPQDGENPGNMFPLRFKPQINPDWRIVHELLLVRARAAKGQLPAFRRGRMFMDFATGMVRVGPYLP